MRTSLPLVHEISPGSFLAEGTRIRGTLTFVSSASVYSVIEGDVFQQSVESLHIGKKGWIHGSVRSLGPIVVEGRVEGDLTAESKVHVTPSGVVNGVIYAPSISVDPGAQLNGQIYVRKTTASSR
jgi:cytoskeletal protein CcmA (bactofilin family)